MARRGSQTGRPAGGAAARSEERGSGCGENGEEGRSKTSHGRAMVDDVAAGDGISGPVWR